MERKWTYRQYHVLDNSNVAHQDVRMHCNTNLFPELSFRVPHSKPHGSKGLIKHYHLLFYLKIGNGVCIIRCRPCDYVSCTSMLENPVYLIYHKMNKSNINLSPSTIIGHYSGP